MWPQLPHVHHIKIVDRRLRTMTCVVVASLLLVVFEQVLIVIAIAFSVVSKTDNVFTKPEFSMPDDPYHVKHILGQLTFGIGAGVLLGTATGCLMLWLLRALVPARAR